MAFFPRHGTSDRVQVRACLRSLSEFAFPWIAIGIPGLTALRRVAFDSVWRDDLPTIRGLGLVALGGPSTLSTVAMQAASLVPLGPLSFRLAVVSALALSLCSALIFTFARKVLEKHVPGLFLNAPLAAMAALAATLGPGLQQEATVAGGATIPLALGLLVLVLYAHDPWPRSQRHLLAAVALGVLVSENLLAAGLVAVSLGFAMVLQRDWPRTRQQWIPLGMMSIVAIVSMLPVLLRPSSPHAILNFGRSYFLFDLESMDGASMATTGFRAWQHELGTVLLVVAALGFIVAMARRRTRWMLAPLLLWVGADALFPASQGGVLTTDLLTPLRSFAIVSLTLGACFGVQSVVTALSDTGLPMAKAAGVLMLAFALTLLGVTAERGTFSVDRTELRGASRYTDEALVKLDPHAMVLARSHALVWRLIAARVVGGIRPDVVLVPLPLVGRGTVATSVIASEPAATMLLRDMALEGSAGEHAVSRVSDRRHVYTELDPAWGVRLASHLKAEGLWLSLESQPLGRSDRRISGEESGKIIERVATVANQSSDMATQSVLLAMVRQQTVAAAMAKDRQATQDLLLKMSSVAPEDRFVRAMMQRVAHAKGASIDVSGLVR